MKSQEIYQALEQLGQLKAQGILSEEEFAQEKAALLALLRKSRESDTSPPPGAAQEATEAASTAAASDSPTAEAEQASVTLLGPGQAAPHADALDIFATGGSAPPVVTPATGPTPAPTGPTPASAQAIPAPTTDAPPWGAEGGADATDLFATGGGAPPVTTSVAPSQPTPASTDAHGADLFATGGPAPTQQEVAPAAQGPLLANRYEVLRELGRGGMGQVLHARDRQSGLEVALKTLHQTGDDATLRRRFLQELTLHERLQHPGIVQVQSLERDPSVGFFFTMDYVEGEPLDKVLAQAKADREGVPFAIPRAIALLTQIADALDHAHAQGVLHLDLKPANVILVGEDARLIDFGIARLRARGSKEQVLGTVYYMAPEQLSGEGDLTAAADIYALGVLTYQLLTGKLFQGGMPGPSHFHNKLPLQVDEVHHQAVAWNPSARFSSAQKLVDALKRALRHSPQTPVSLEHEGRQEKPYTAPQAPRGRKELRVETAEKTTSEKHWPQVLERQKRKRPLWLDPPFGQKPPTLVPAHKLDREQTAMLPVAPRQDSTILLSKEKLPLLELCPVPEGRYPVGADKKDRLARRPEKPRQTIQLSGFWIARTPVTNAAWHCFLQESRYQPDKDAQHPAYLAHWGKGEAPPETLRDHPVNFISLLHAWAFCDFYGLSLPSEAQWEASARGPQGHTTPWGHTDAPPADAPLTNLDREDFESSAVYAHPDGASHYGLLDTLGNVQQWTADEYDARWLRQLRERDPVIQIQDRARFTTIRGAHATMPFAQARLYRRDNDHADACKEEIGFRPCIDLHVAP